MYTFMYVFKFNWFKSSMREKRTVNIFKKNVNAYFFTAVRWQIKSQNSQK